MAANLGLRQRSDLDQQREHQCRDTEWPDVGAPHDLERFLRGLAAAKTVSEVAKAVEMQATGEQRQCGEREDGREQRSHPEKVIGGAEHDRSSRSEHQAHGRREGHRNGRCLPGHPAGLQRQHR